MNLLAVGVLGLGDPETAQQAGDGGLADVRKTARAELAADLLWVLCQCWPMIWRQASSWSHLAPVLLGG